MAEIVGLDRSSVDREKPGRDERIAELLANLTAMNDRGELRSICYAYATTDHTAGSNWSYYPGPISAVALVGAMEVLKHEMIVGMLEQKSERPAPTPDPAS